MISCKKNFILRANLEGKVFSHSTKKPINNAKVLFINCLNSDCNAETPTFTNEKGNFYPNLYFHLKACKVGNSLPVLKAIKEKFTVKNKNLIRIIGTRSFSSLNIKHTCFCRCIGIAIFAGY